MIILVAFDRSDSWTQRCFISAEKYGKSYMW